MADRHGGSGGNSGVYPAEAGPKTLAFQTAGAGTASAGMYHGQMPASGDHPPVTPHWEFFYRVAERFGIPVVVLLFVLYWAKHDVVQPLLDAHFSVVQKITNAQERQANELVNIGEKLDTLIRLSNDK